MRRQVLAFVVAASACAAALFGSPIAIADVGHAGGVITTSRSLGANTAAWDGNFLTPDIPSLLQAAHIGVLRYPGGSWADEYDWETNTVNGQTNSVDWQQFRSISATAGAVPFVTVNYGSGTPAEAAAWVAATRDDPALANMWWEIGNENYGPWETDTHPNPHTPQSYATYAAQFLQAMHAVNPAAKIGMPYALTVAQAAGTGTGVTDPLDWNRTILSQDGRQFSFVDVHWYPFYGTPTLTPEQILATVRKIPEVMRSVKGTLAEYAPQASVVLGESNISNANVPYNVEPVAALFAAGTALEWISQGAESFDWWDLHNYGSPAGDYGMLSSGTSGEPPVDTPFPSYYGYQLASLLTTPGSRLEAIPTTSPTLLEFRAQWGDRTSVMLINSDSTAPRTVTIGHFDHGETLQTYSYSAANPTITTSPVPARELHGKVQLAPESIKVIVGRAQ
jgi:hypothetical protein